jgi:hypothetical protein
MFLFPNITMPAFFQNIMRFILSILLPFHGGRYALEMVPATAAAAAPDSLAALLGMNIHIWKKKDKLTLAV